MKVYLDAKFEDKLPLLSKMTCGIWEIFTRALESVQIGALMGFFLPKVENVWA